MKDIRQTIKYADSLITNIESVISDRKLIFKKGRIEIYEFSSNEKTHYEIIFFNKVIKRYRKKSSVEKWLNDNFKNKKELDKK